MALEWIYIEEDQSDKLTYVDTETGAILGSVSKNYGERSWCSFACGGLPASYISQEQAKQRVEAAVASLQLQAKEK